MNPDRTNPDPCLVEVVTTLTGARRAARLTQTDLADKAGLSQATVSRVEAGASSSFVTLATYARAIGWRLRAIPDGTWPDMVADAADAQHWRDDGAPVNDGPAR